MTFTYHSFETEGETVTYRFSLGEYEFAPSWNFHAVIPDTPLYKRALFLLGMAEAVSYWKAACPQRFVIANKPFMSLSGYEKIWWKKLFRRGLGEFFFRNGINPLPDFVVFECETRTDERIDIPGEFAGNLIPVGGGKDSVVTLELLKDMPGNSAFVINPRDFHLRCCETAEVPQVFTAERRFDERLLELNRRGFLNGHTPFSAVAAFGAFICALLHEKKYIVLSNESSANEGNVTAEGDFGVNHQYSKSYEFERDFRDLINQNFSAPPYYFSLLRPWNEWRIVKEFVRRKKYLPVFLSCNLGSKTSRWCGKCPKCLYMYIMLAAFLPDSQLIEIFGANLLDDASFDTDIQGLLFPEKVKPFECVGTREEVAHALAAAYSKRRENTPELLRRYRGEQSPDISDYFDIDNGIPTEFINYVR